MIGINLIDGAVLADRRRKRRVRRWVLAAGAAGLVATVPVFMEWSRHQQVVSLRAERGALEAQIESTRSKLNQLGNEIRNLEAQTARANTLRSKRSWSRLLSVVSEVMPQDLWLVSIATDPPRPVRGNRDLRPKKPKQGAAAQDGDDAPQVVTMEAPRALTFDGYALVHRDLYDFMSGLKGTDVFADVSLTKATEEPVFSAKAVRFKIHCRW